MCSVIDNKWDKLAMRESFYMLTFVHNTITLIEEIGRNWRMIAVDGLKNQELFIVCGPVLYKSDVSYIGMNGKFGFPMLF